MHISRVLSISKKEIFRILIFSNHKLFGGSLFMRPIKRKMQFVYLQEQYCKSCVFRKNSLQYCSEFCNIGKELVLLNALGFKRRKRKELTKKEKWDQRCNKAASLFAQGESYPDIAKTLGCHISQLYYELKKRNLFSYPSQKK